MGMRRGDVTRRRGAVFYELSLTGGFRNCHWETIHAYVTKKRLIYEKSAIIRNVNVIHCLLENTITLNYLIGSGGFRRRHFLKNLTFFYGKLCLNTISHFNFSAPPPF